MNDENGTLILLLVAAFGWLLLRDDGGSGIGDDDELGQCQRFLSRAADWIEAEGGDFDEIVD